MVFTVSTSATGASVSPSATGGSIAEAAGSETGCNGHDGRATARQFSTPTHRGVGPLRSRAIGVPQAVLRTAAAALRALAWAFSSARRPQAPRCAGRRPLHSTCALPIRTAIQPRPAGLPLGLLAATALPRCVPTRDDPSPGNSLRFEVDSQGVQPGTLRPASAACRPSGLPRRPAALPTPDAGHPIRPAGPQVFGLRGLGSQGLVALQLPLATFVGQRGLRGFDFRAKRCSSASCAAAARQFPPSGFPKRPAALPTPDAGHPTRPAGPQVFGFRGLGSQGLVVLRFPLATFVGQRRSRADSTSARSCCQFGLLRRGPLGSFRLLRFPRRPAAPPTPDAGHPTRPAGPQAVRLPRNAKSRPRRVATPTADARRPTRFRAVSTSARSACSSASCAAGLSAVSDLCVSQAACCSSNA